MRKNSGFTAFELAVTMAIMVVIAALVLPPYLKRCRLCGRKKGVQHEKMDIDDHRNDHERPGLCAGR